MKTTTRNQLIVLGVLVAAYALIAFATYIATPLEQLAAPGQPLPPTVSAIPRWQLALANTGFVLVAYGLLGLAAYWFASKVGLPGIYRPQAGWSAWLIWPLVLGLGSGIVLVILDRLILGAGSTGRFPHPAFPLSVLASGAAGIGEEILFRGFVMGLWAILLRLVLRGDRSRPTVFWIANAVAALAFGASHIPSAILLFNVPSPSALPPPILVELFLLNGILGLVAGERTMRDGLVAAMGVHFWADIVWHVIWPLLGLGP